MIKLKSGMLRTYDYELLTEEEKIDLINDKEKITTIGGAVYNREFIDGTHTKYGKFNDYVKKYDRKFYEKYKLLFEKV
jgi:hypothetical protein